MEFKELNIIEPILRLLKEKGYRSNSNSRKDYPSTFRK
jgi:hypothetical protein